MTGDSRRGRRDNGLDAAAFVPLLDVDPRVGEHLLDVLASAGVPAYLEPSADVEPYTRALSLPSPPTDRLWVDRDQRRQARIIVDAETPLGPRPVPPPRDDEPSHGLADAEEERAWQAIIAGFDAPAVDPHRSADRPDLGDGDRLPGPQPRPDEAHPAEGADWFGDPPIGRPGPERDDLIVDPWSDLETGRRGRRWTRGGGGTADGDRLPGPQPRPDEAHPAEGADWFGDPPIGRPGPERDDLIVDPWSDLETGRRGRRWTRGGGGTADADRLPSGKDLDKAADARARHEAEAAREDAEDVWIDGPPTLDSGDDEHFEPPPPPPFPRPSRNTLLAILLVVIGVLLIAVPQLIGMDDRTGMTLGVLAVLSGGVLLVLRLREARDDDDPDDGAVV